MSDFHPIFVLCVALRLFELTDSRSLQLQGVCHLELRSMRSDESFAAVSVRVTRSGHAYKPIEVGAS